MVSYTSITIILLLAAFAAWSEYKRGCHYVDKDLATYENLGSVFITGANTGIGLESARGLIRRGVHVILGCRSKAKCDDAKAQLLKETPHNSQGVSLGRVDVEEINLSSLASVRSCVDRLKQYKDLRTLVNNAGIFDYSLEPPKVGTMEPHFAVNHLAHFYLTKLLLPIMKTQANGRQVRVIIVSSEGHRMAQNGINFDAPGFPVSYTNPEDFSHFGAYVQSKLANILHAYELAEREKGNKVTVVSLHPGFVATDIFRTFPSFLEKLVVHVAPYLIAKTSWEGAQTTLHCVLDPSVEQHSGSYFDNCAPARVVWPTSLENNEAARREYAQRLWNLSEELLKRLE